MKLKKKYPLLIVAAFTATTLYSCSPTAPGIDSTSLIHTKAGSVIKNDTNNYTLSLSCGCDFELSVEGEDNTRAVVYDISDIPTKLSKHFIRASAKPNLASGTYTGWLAVITLKPDTNPDLRDTLRDTVIVP